jgi:hypothetical protein
MATQVIDLIYGFIVTDNVYSGVKCRVCDDHIYGVGHNIVLTVKTRDDILPRFKETEFTFCQSCKNGNELFKQYFK